MSKGEEVKELMLLCNCCHGGVELAQLSPLPAFANCLSYQQNKSERKTLEHAGNAHNHQEPREGLLVA